MPVHAPQIAEYADEFNAATAVLEGDHHDGDVVIVPGSNIIAIVRNDRAVAVSRYSGRYLTEPIGFTADHWSGYEDSIELADQLTERCRCTLRPDIDRIAEQLR